MDVHSVAIFGTRPWKVCGEGPQLAEAAPIQNQGFNEGKGKQFTGADIRYTARGDVIYAFVMGKPAGEIKFTSLGAAARLLEKPVKRVEQLGVGDVKWRAGDEALVVTADLSNITAADQTVVFRITTR
jgi:alpha-L-fucosidase